jgi:spore maturation protein CgeB
VEAGLDVGLYGGGWGEIPDLAAHAYGVLRSGRELSAVYSAAKLVLHINGTMNCHVRVFECLAAEGLPLCRSHAGDFEPGGLNDALRIGQEVLCFDGRQDLLDKVSDLLRDEPRRRSMARAGRQRVLDEHCMKHRMQRTLDEIRKELSGGQADSGICAGPSEGLAAAPRPAAATGS